MGDKVVTEIKSTKDYGRFKFKKGNREIRDSHVARLADKFRRKYLGFSSPIIVNKKFEILEGQHRFLAAKELSLPIYYTIISNVDDIRDVIIPLNTGTKNWSYKDYLHLWKSKNKKPYIILSDFCEEHNLSVRNALPMFRKSMSGKADYGNDFKEGFLNITDKDLNHANQIIEKYNLIKDYFPFSSFLSFVAAFIKILNHPDFEWDRFYENVKKHSQIVGKRSTTHDYCKELQKLYNRGRHLKKRIYEEDL